MKNLLQYTEKLKQLPRTGWLRYGIENPETVASHSWQMAMMAIQISNQTYGATYDFYKLIKLCLCHDLGESIIGDITPNDKSYTNKEAQETKAIDVIVKDTDLPEIYELYSEYLQNETPEAQLANDLDKLDMFAQALDYEKKYPHKDLSEFKHSAVSHIKTAIGKKILEQLK